MTSPATVEVTVGGGEPQTVSELMPGLDVNQDRLMKGRTTKYTPTLRGGAPVEVVMSVIVSFYLK
jgi:hypothetical protein